jgi:hypothetical protein
MLTTSALYKVPSAVYVVLARCKVEHKPDAVESAIAYIREQEDPLFLYNLVQLEPIKFLQLISTLEGMEQMKMVELPGLNKDKWFLENWPKMVNLIFKDPKFNLESEQAASFTGQSPTLIRRQPLSPVSSLVSPVSFLNERKCSPKNQTAQLSFGR